jgi:hypothetical protein
MVQAPVPERVMAPERVQEQGPELQQQPMHYFSNPTSHPRRWFGEPYDLYKRSY